MSRIYDAILKLEDKFSPQLQKMEEHLDSFGKEYTRVGKDLKKIGKGFTSVGNSMTKYLTAPLAAAATVGVKSFIDFESAFAGVRKTVDASEEEFARLEKGIREMSKRIPASAVDIAAVAEAAGQLGIQNENILEFTETMIALGEATNLSADEAATAFARFSNITGMSQKDFDKLGSTVVALGNNLATTEAEIVNMAMRLAGAGNQIGMTEAEIMSLSAALSSVGIEAEAGGSAMSTVMINMQLASEKGGKSLRNYAKVAGMSEKAFAQMFKSDPTGALLEFINGLSMAEARGTSAIRILDDMGITEKRLRDTLLRAAGASDVFSHALDIGSEAWEKNTALTKEASERYNTTMSKLKVIKGKLLDAAMVIGEKLVPTLMGLAEGAGKVADWFSKLDAGTVDLIVKIGMVLMVIGPFLKIMGGIITTASTLFIKFGALSAAITKAGGIMKWIMLPANLLVLKILAIIAVIVAVILIFKNWGKILDWFKDKLGKLGDWIGKIGEGISNFFNKPRQLKYDVVVDTPEVPGVPDVPKIDVARKIPQFARGIRHFRGGLAEINERGRGEIVDLPRGSRVYPHDKSVGQAYRDGKSAGTTVTHNNINIPKLADQVILRSEVDMDTFLDKMAIKLKWAQMNAVKG